MPDPAVDEVVTGGAADRGRDAPSWTPARAEPLSQKIVADVRAALFDGRLRAGDFLGTEPSLAAQFGVSRMVVRDALRVLMASGVVTIRPGAKGGARIASANPDVVSDALAIQLTLLGVTEEEVLEAELALEAWAAELAAVRRDEDDLAALREGISRLTATPADDAVAFAERAVDIHGLVVRAAHNPVLDAQFATVRRLLCRSYERHLAERGRHGAAVEANRRLVRLVEQQDAAGARWHMEQRMRSIMRRVDRKLPSPPER
ncbi:MAG: FadR/GntR family transcriptional regulator [Kineosporiaceae bacterium]